jgi:hypothetical protein
MGDQMLQIYIENAFKEIKRTVGSQKPETGGVLLGYRKDFIVQKFFFDHHGKNTSSGYDPNVEFVNKIVKREWEQNKLEFLGFIHSHPRGVEFLSNDRGNGIGDLGYIKVIFNAMPKLKRLLVPIIYSSADGGDFRIFPYYANRDDSKVYKTARLKII